MYLQTYCVPSKCVSPQPESVFCSIDLEHLEYLANQKTFFDSNLRMTAKIRSVLKGRPVWLADSLPVIFSPSRKLVQALGNPLCSMIVIFPLETTKKFHATIPLLIYLSTKIK